MEAGKVLQEVKALCADKKYEEAKSLILIYKQLKKSMINKNRVKECRTMSEANQELKHFFGITE
ncbi:hypothetical protein EfmJHP35_13520 [Enterococcus faecium]|nr:hypothetical protein EfmJHP35_13520 [Enterococcus faecium]